MGVFFFGLIIIMILVFILIVILLGFFGEFVGIIVVSVILVINVLFFLLMMVILVVCVLFVRLCWNWEFLFGGICNEWFGWIYDKLLLFVLKYFWLGVGIGFVFFMLGFL